MTQTCGSRWARNDKVGDRARRCFAEVGDSRVGEWEDVQGAVGSQTSGGMFLKSVANSVFDVVIFYCVQKTYDDRMARIEDEYKTLRDTMEDLVQALKTSHVQVEGKLSSVPSSVACANKCAAAGSLKKERKSVEEIKIDCFTRLDNMQQLLAKTQRDVTVLQSQWKANKLELHQLSDELAPTQVAAESLSARLVEMEENEQSIWLVLNETRESLHELVQGQENVGQIIGESVKLRSTL